MTEEWVSYMITAAMIILAMIFFFSRNKALREKRLAQKNLEDTLSNLEAVYSEVNTTQEELNAKYRELKASEDRIKKLAYEDSMTGLPNRAAFLEVLEHTMETLRKDESVAVMDMDLDNFKEINDLWGNSCGDELLLDISHRLKQNLDEDDYLARTGSDEFLILTQNIREISDYEEKVKRIQKAFRFPFVLSVSEFMITVSIGVVLGPRDGKTAPVLIRRADTALAQAKWLGKNTYCYYTEALEQKRLEDMELRTDLTAAMKQDDFFLRYQPMVGLSDNTCRGVRLELCWDRKEKGIWRARKFEHFAEETGQIIDLGERAFRRACKDRRIWVEAGKKDYDIIVPVSKRQFLNQSFEQIICTIAEEEETSLEHFIFEIQERILVGSFEDCAFLMKELSGRGFRFRIGDFGSGRMSLDCVRDLPVEQAAVSIRRIFQEHEAEESERYFKIVTGALSGFGKKIVVTDVSDAIEERLAADFADPVVQGELYGDSLSAEEVLSEW